MQANRTSKNNSTSEAVGVPWHLRIVDYFKSIALNIPHTAWTDSLLLAGVLFFGNALLAPYDLGWLKLYPSPWALLPILIGSKYGVAPGLTSGALAATITLLMRAHLESASVSNQFHDHIYRKGQRIPRGLPRG